MLHIKGPAGVKVQKHYMASLPVLLPSLSVASIGQMQSHSLGQGSWTVAFHLAWEAQAPAFHTQGLMGRCSGPGLLSPPFSCHRRVFPVGAFVDITEPPQWALEAAWPGLASFQVESLPRCTQAEGSTACSHCRGGPAALL